MTTAAAITYLYDYLFEGVTHQIAVTRKFIGETVFPRNGNVHNPTKTFTWTAEVNGQRFPAHETRAVAYEYARASVAGIDYRNVENYPTKNVRNFRLVADEMKANYVGKA